MRDENGRFVKGYKPEWSSESRKKVSDSLKGKNTWSKGKILSDEHKRKLSENGSMYWLGKKRPEMTGKLHPNWKENKKSPVYRAIRESFKYKSWRMEILKKDKFLCVLCGQNKKLEADHYPKRFVDLLNELKIDTFEQAINSVELWKGENGRTLCRSCHLQTPTWGKRTVDLEKQ